MTGAPVRILIADSHPIVREGLKAALGRVSDFEIVAEAGDGFAAVMGVKTARPDVLILDSGIDGLDPFDTISRALAAAADLRVLVTYVSEDAFEVRQLVQAGARGFIAKTAPTHDYVSAVSSIMGGGSFFTQSITASLFARDGAAGHGPLAHGLSQREAEVLRFIAAGFSNKDIARRLDLSVRTVETHRLNIRKKTNAGRLKDLVQIARKLGRADVADAAPSAGDLKELSTADAHHGK